MNIGIVGSRTFTDYTYFCKCLLELIFIERINKIISGGARGADSLGERFAKEYGINFDIFVAEWDLFGKSAGFKRNKSIVDESDLIIAFWDGKSKGTKDTLNKAAKSKKTSIIFYI
jgi:hypothetical protein